MTEFPRTEMETFGSAPALVLITKGGTNTALTVATPCYLHIYSTRTPFLKKKNHDMVL